MMEPEVTRTSRSNPLFYLANPILFIWDLRALLSPRHLIRKLLVDKIGKIYPTTFMCNRVCFYRLRDYHLDKMLMIKQSRGKEEALYHLTHMVNFHFFIHYSPLSVVLSNLVKASHGVCFFSLSNKICCGLIFTLWVFVLVKCPTLLYQQKSNILQRKTHEHETKAHKWRLNNYEDHSEGFCPCSSLHQRTKQLRHIKISQAYIWRGTHKCTHSTNSRAVTQGQRRRLISIMGKGAKSRWYEGGYINANCTESY